MTFFRSRILLLTSFTISAATAVLQATPALAQSPIRNFDIPAQALSSAILEFSKQSNVMIVVSPQLTAGKRSHAVKGSLPNDVAIDLLLRGSGLHSVPIRGGGYHVESTAAAPSPADVMQPAGDTSLEGAVSDSKEAAIVVTGRPFLSVDTSGATNLPIPVEKVPQSISIVSEAFIKAANVKSIGDVADYTAGANNYGNPLGLATVITLRGFSAGRAIDGLSVFSAQSYFEPDNAIIERLEIVKGPSSVVYGVSSPGGLVNYVTKSAKPDTRSYAYGQIGSWDSFRAEGQAAGGVGPSRLIGVAVYDQGDSFIHVLNHKSTTLYGGANVDLTDRLSAYVHGGYVRQQRTAFDGIPTEADGSPAPLPRSFFIGSKDMKVRTAVYHADADISWKATRYLRVTAKGVYEHSNSTGLTPYAFGLEDNGTIGLGLQALHAKLETTSVGVLANYALDQLGLEDSFVSVSALSQKIRQDTPIEFYGGSATSNIFDGEAAISADFEALRGELLPYDYFQSNRTRTVAIQSLIHPVSPLGILLGASYSKANANVTAQSVPVDFDFKGKVSLRSGITYEATRGLNGYISFSQSFNPQTARTINNQPLAPLEGDQYEAGLKYRSGNKKLLLTAAIYKIVQKNKAVYDQSTSEGDFYKALGRVRHQGIELEAVGSILPQLQINASYSYLQTRIEDDADSASIGKRDLFIPKHSASLYTTYTLDGRFAPGFSAGGGFRYIGSSTTSYDRSTKDLHGYFLVDANIGYATRDWIFQINARNVFDRRYYINNYKTLFYGNVVGEPANVSLSVQRKF
jgi:iron complex outermembrane receptor protein